MSATAPLECWRQATGFCTFEANAELAASAGNEACDRAGKELAEHFKASVHLQLSVEARGQNPLFPLLCRCITSRAECSNC